MGATVLGVTPQSGVHMYQGVHICQGARCEPLCPSPLAHLTSEKPSFISRLLIAIATLCACIRVAPVMVPPLYFRASRDDGAFVGWGCRNHLTMAYVAR